MFPIKIEMKEIDNVSFFKISGRIDQQTYYDLRDKLRACIAAGKNKIVVDLANVDVVSGGGWNTIANDRDYAAKSNGDIKLCCMNEKVSAIFKSMDLIEFINTYNTVDEAINSFK